MGKEWQYAILKEIKQTKNENLDILIFENQNQITEVSYFKDDNLKMPKLRIGTTYHFATFQNKSFTNLAKKFAKNKKAYAYEIEEAQENPPQPPQPQNFDNDSTSNKEILKELAEIRQELSQAQQTIAQALTNLKQKQTSQLIKQACTEAAAEIVASQKPKDAIEAYRTTIEIAKQFEKYCTGGEDEKQ